jgi:hypothetical protein
VSTALDPPATTTRTGDGDDRERLVDLAERVAGWARTGENVEV